MERLEGPPVDVGHVPVLDLEVIDLERIDRLERVLPAAILDWSRAGDLLAGLCQVDVKRGTIDHEVTYQAAMEQRTPVHAGAEQANARNGRIRVRVLDQDQLGDVERETDRMEVELADVRGIPLQRPVHLCLGVAPERLVDQEGDAEGDGEDEADHRAHHEPAAWNSVGVTEPRPREC